MTAKYIDRAEVARLMKKELTAKYAGVSFSITSKTYSGGGSITIKWTDGPTESQVEHVVSKFESRGFDGSIDMEYIIRHYIKGGKLYTYSTGTEGSRGSVPAWGKLPEGAEEIHINTGYVFCNRTLSREAIQTVMNNMIERGYLRPEQWHFTEYGGYDFDNATTDSYFLSRVFHRTSLEMTL